MPSFITGCISNPELLFCRRLVVLDCCDGQSVTEATVKGEQDCTKDAFKVCPDSVLSVLHDEDGDVAMMRRSIRVFRLVVARRSMEARRAVFVGLLL